MIFTITGPSYKKGAIIIIIITSITGKFAYREESGEFAVIIIEYMHTLG